MPADEQEEVFGFLDKMGEYHPTEPHWYLPLIGVDVSKRGRGYGSTLLRHALERCDRDGLPAYLEATSPRSKPLYERHGFEELGMIQEGSSPPLWPMQPARPRAVANQRPPVSGPGVRSADASKVMVGVCLHVRASVEPGPTPRRGSSAESHPTPCEELGIHFICVVLRNLGFEVREIPLEQSVLHGLKVNEQCLVIDRQNVEAVRRPVNHLLRKVRLEGLDGRDECIAEKIAIPVTEIGSEAGFSQRPQRVRQLNLEARTRTRNAGQTQRTMKFEERGGDGRTRRRSIIRHDMAPQRDVTTTDVMNTGIDNVGRRNNRSIGFTQPLRDGQLVGTPGLVRRDLRNNGARTQPGDDVVRRPQRNRHVDRNPEPTREANCPTHGVHPDRMPHRLAGDARIQSGSFTT